MPSLPPSPRLPGDSPLNPDGELRLVNRTSENGSISASGW